MTFSLRTAAASVIGAVFGLSIMLGTSTALTAINAAPDTHPVTANPHAAVSVGR